MKATSFNFLLRIIFLIIIFFQVISVVVAHPSIYQKGDYWQRFPALEKSYLSSQYVNKNPKGWIPDEAVNAYAGGALIRGVNPIYIIPDTPPLGKYLIGLSANIFNNEAIAVLLFAILSLFLLYVISFSIFRSVTWALVVPLLVSSEKIFQNQLIYTPLYDMFQLAFLLTSFIFFNKALESKKYILYFLLSNIALGLFISTKFFATGLTIVMAGVIVLLLRRMIRVFILYIVSSGVAVAVLLVSYLRAFVLNPDLHEYLGIQKWVFLYHKSQLILPFSIWPLMLLNRWHVWFGDKPVISDTQWQITWPIITIFSFISIALYLIKKIGHDIKIEILMAWVILYFLFFSFGQVTSRYFVILIPVLYMVSIFGVFSLVNKNLSSNLPKKKK